MDNARALDHLPDQRAPGGLPMLPWLLGTVRCGRRLRSKRSLSLTLGGERAACLCNSLFATGPLFGRAPHPFKQGDFKNRGKGQTSGPAYQQQCRPEAHAVNWLTSDKSVSARARRRSDGLPPCAQKRGAKWCNERHPLPWQRSFARQTDRAAPARSTLFLAHCLGAWHPGAA